LLLEVGDVAESAAGRVGRFAPGRASAAVFRLAHRQVEGELVVQVALEAAPMRQREQPVPESEQLLHEPRTHNAESRT